MQHLQSQLYSSNQQTISIMVGKYCLFGIHDLDGNIVVIRENGTVKDYIAFTDNLGSILSVMDENGTKVFDTSYDAWGGGCR